MFPATFPQSIKNAFEAVPRHLFVKGVAQIYGPLEYEFEDVILQLESGKNLGNCLRALNIEPGNSVLDIGCGTGFTAALCAVIAGPNGFVKTVDIDPLMLGLAQRRFQHLKFVSHAPILIAHESCFAPTDNTLNVFDRIFCIETKCPDALLPIILSFAKPQSIVVVRNYYWCYFFIACS